jgi:TonB family protein
MASVLFESAVRAALIAAAVALVLRAMRIESAALRHATWAGVVVIMLLLPALVTWGPEASLRVLPPETRESATPLGPTAGDPSVVAAEPRAATALDSAPQGSSWTWRTSAVSLYLLGLGIFLLRLALGTLQVRHLVRTAVLDKGRRTHALCATPVTVGWLKPTVILPSDWCRWPEGQLDAILAHEGEHLRRRDPLFQWVALLNRAVFWFHPLAWWLERHVSFLAEEACDAAVLARGHDPGEYSQCLLNLARSAARAGGRFPRIGMAMPGAHLPYRIRQVLDGAHAPRVSRMRFACTAALCAIAGATFASGTLAHDERAPAPFSVLNQTNTDVLSRRSLAALTSRDPAQKAGAAQHAPLVRNEGDARGPQIVRDDSQEAASKSRDHKVRDAAGLPDLNLKIENSEGAPLTIVAATAEVSNLKSLKGEPDDYAITPSITMVNNTRQPIAAFSLNIKNVESNFEYDAGRAGADIRPGGTFSGSLGRFVGLPGDPHYLKIKVVGVEFDDGSHWGQLVALIRSAQQQSLPFRTGGPIAAVPSAVASTSTTGSAPEGLSAVPPGARTDSERGGPVAAVASAIKRTSMTKSASHRNLPYFTHGNSRMVRLGGGGLHNHAIKRVQPSRPAGAAAGTVVVEVIVDEEGNVESARVTSGQPFGVATSNDPLLIGAALEAARQWRFKPEKAAGSPVKVIGELFVVFQ